MIILCVIFCKLLFINNCFYHMCFPFCQDSTYNLLLVNGNLTLGFFTAVSFASTQFCYKHVTHVSCTPVQNLLQKLEWNWWVITYRFLHTAQKERMHCLSNSIKFPIIQIFSVCPSLLESWGGSPPLISQIQSTLITWCLWPPISVLRTLRGVRPHLPLKQLPESCP